MLDSAYLIYLIIFKGRKYRDNPSLAPIILRYWVV